MSKRRVKQQNVSVIDLFTLAGRHKEMDDVFVYHECHSTRWSHSPKNKKQTNSIKTTFATYLLLCLSVCSFFHMPFPYVLHTCSFVCFINAFPSYTFCLVVRFNCIKRAVFKPLIFPAYSINIVIVIFDKWPTLLSDLSHPFAVHDLPFLLFLPVLTSGHP